MARSAADQLATYQHRYRELAERIADIGFIATGSVVRTHNRCGKPHRRCHADPPHLHGPYWQWTAKVNGKTLTRRLSESETGLYQEWIRNDRKLRALIAEMRHMAAKATELITKDQTPDGTEV
jgi:hypothetical protein